MHRRATPPNGSSADAVGFTNGLRSDPVDARSGDKGAEGGLTNGRTNGLTNGRTNGLTNGRLRGRTNGLTNGLTNGGSRLPFGLTNGKTNGITNGFVNGRGAVNGFRLSYQQRKVAGAPSDARKKLVVVGVLVVLVLALPYALVYAFPPADVEIDGYFMDWLEAQVYRDDPDSANPDIAITAYAMRGAASRSYYYVATEGSLFQGRDGGADGFYIFIDRDGSAASGYEVRGIGADAMVAVIGWNNSVQLSQTYSFDPGASQMDYGGFSVAGDAQAAFDSGEMEVGTGVTISGDAVVAVCARSTNTSDDWSEANFGLAGPSVRVVEDHVAPEVTDGVTDELVMTLTVTAKGPDAELLGLDFEFLGDTVPTELTAIMDLRLVGTTTNSTLELTDPVRLGGDPVELQILASFPEGSKGGSFGLDLDDEKPLTVSPNATVFISSVQSGEQVSYIEAAPDSVVIDGAFADWSHLLPLVDLVNDTVDDAGAPVANADIDISSVKLDRDGTVASFYMSVDGRMLGGTNLPGGVARWQTPSGAAGNVTNITETMYGADFAFAFIDIDMNESTGFYLGGSEVSISIVGKDGVILSSGAHAYIDGEWVSVGAVDAAIDLQRLEFQASYELLGIEPGNAYPVTFIAQDWRGAEDNITVGLWAIELPKSKLFGGIVINEIYNGPGANDWMELYNTGPTPIDITGWKLAVYDGSGRLLFNYTFPAYIMQPHEFQIFYGEFGRGTFFVLWDSSLNLIDTAYVPFWNARSYGRIGTPEEGYSNWSFMTPTPRAVNEGQVAIPEFGGILAPIAIMPIIMFIIGRKRLRRARGQKDSTGQE